MKSSPSAVKEEIHFYTRPSIHPSEKAGNLQGDHDGGESKWKTSKHHCPRET